MWKIFATLALCLAVSSAIQLKNGEKRPLFNKDRQSKQSDQQVLSLYDYYGETGVSNYYTDYAPALGVMDDISSSGHFCGIWLLYDEYDYNRNNPIGESGWAWGDTRTNCYDQDFTGFGDNKASSLRLTGAPDGFYYDTINFYSYEGFNGDEEFFYGDTPQMNLDNRAQSVIVTGCSAWTLYQYDDYQGYSCCMDPSDYINCYPGFYPYASDFGSLRNAVSSARKGCFSGTPACYAGGKSERGQQYGYYNGPQK